MTAIELLHDLRCRGFDLRRNAAGRLVVSPGSQLTDTDCRLIRSRIHDLLGLVELDTEWLTERAGILEHDGGLTRAEAERAAATLLRDLMARSRGAPA